METETNKNKSKEDDFATLIQDLYTFKKKLDPFRRMTFLPVTEEVKLRFSSESKIGGLPYLRNEKDWPVCPICSKNQDLFLQLDLSKLPKNEQEGLLQLFYCTSGEGECENMFGAFDQNKTIRKIEVQGAPVKVKPNIDKLFREKVITSWETHYEYPHPEEYNVLGIDKLVYDDISDILDERGITLPIRKDKLYGWPYWIQGAVYPFDRKTNTQMQVIFQLAAHDNLGYGFGDGGIGHLTQSIDNENEFGFVWAGH
ncbi:hypothetical protein GCM10022393_42380 [Aquimarina addita]|uniref:DUF1963 domain-containing protein n=1 Tax=Aquimarina addita TaxID=870485 RepID=A0ABP6UY01_9FLAO